VLIVKRKDLQPMLLREQVERGVFLIRAAQQQPTVVISSRARLEYESGGIFLFLFRVTSVILSSSSESRIVSVASYAVSRDKPHEEDCHQQENCMITLSGVLLLSIPIT
jgi:hypothetical protein